MRVTPAVVAFTEIWYAPAGVPCCGGNVFCSPLDPPPQPKNSATVSSAIASSSHTRRGGLESRCSAASVTNPKTSKSQGNTKRKPGPEDGVRQATAEEDRAFVVTVTVAFAGVVPFTGNELGATTQFESVAGEAQVSNAVPLNPAVPTTVTV